MLSGRAGSRGFGPAINYVLRELLISICGPQQCETAKNICLMSVLGCQSVDLSVRSTIPKKCLLNHNNRR